MEQSLICEVLAWNCLGTKTEGTFLEGTVFGPTGVKIDIFCNGCDF